MTDDLTHRLRDEEHLQQRHGFPALLATAREAADRIEELTATNEQLSNCVAVLEADLRKMTLDYLAAQGQASENFQMYVDANEARIDAEAKLSKAVKALDEAWYMLTVPHLNYEPEPEEPGLRRIKTALAAVSETHKLSKERRSERRESNPDPARDH